MKFKLFGARRVRTGAPEIIQFILQDECLLDYGIFLKKHERADGIYNLTLDNTLSRSLPQNAFFHGLFLEAVMKWSGDMDKDHWKSFFKREFLRYQDENGKWQTRGTSELSIDEFSVFLDNCIHKFWDMGGNFDAECAKKYKEMQNDVKQMAAQNKTCN